MAELLHSSEDMQDFKTVSPRNTRTTDSVFSEGHERRSSIRGSIIDITELENQRRSVKRLAELKSEECEIYRLLDRRLATTMSQRGLTPKASSIKAGVSVADISRLETMPVITERKETIVEHPKEVLEEKPSTLMKKPSTVEKPPTPEKKTTTESRLVTPESKPISLVEKKTTPPTEKKTTPPTERKTTPPADRKQTPPDDRKPTPIAERKPTPPEESRKATPPFERKPTPPAERKTPSPADRKLTAPDASKTPFQESRSVSPKPKQQETEEVLPSDYTSSSQGYITPPEGLLVLPQKTALISVQKKELADIHADVESKAVGADQSLVTREVVERILQGPVSTANYSLRQLVPVLYAGGLWAVYCFSAVRLLGSHS